MVIGQCNGQFCKRNGRQFFSLELCRLRGKSAVQLNKEINALRQEATQASKSGNDATETWTMKSIWAKPHLRWPLVSVMVLHLGNQLSGINAVSCIYFPNLQTNLTMTFKLTNSNSNYYDLLTYLT